MALKDRYSRTAPRSLKYAHSGPGLKKFGGLVTGIGQSNIPPDSACSMLNLTRENGSLSVRTGYRNIVVPQASVTTIKGFFYCQTYVSDLVHEGVVAFLNDGALKGYELSYDSTNDLWGYHLLSSAAGAVTFNDTYWRRVCFQDTVYLFNTNDSNPVYSYTLGTYASLVIVKPPASPANPPSIAYYLNGSSGYVYTKYWGAQGSYATGDVSRTGAVDAITSISGTYIKAHVNATGAFSVTPDLKHSGGNTDLTQNDVFSFSITVNDTTQIAADLENIVVTVNGSGSQDLVVTIAGRQYDAQNQLKTVTYYCKFGGKTRASWTTATTFTISGFITTHAGDDYLFFSPLTAGGIVDWGETTVAVEQLSYSYYDSTTLFESGLSPALTLDLAKLHGQLLSGNTQFPMGSMPVVTVSAGPADYFRLYGRVKLSRNQQSKAPDQFSAWRRIVEQLDSTTTYSYTTLPNDFQALTEYAPATFDYTGVVAAYQSNNHVVWLYAGGTKNVRRSRDGVAVAQASTDDAFKTSISQDDVLRGANYTLVGDFQDEPVGGVELAGADVILGKNNVYISYDLGDGLPSGFSHPEPVASAPGCMGYHAFCKWHDGEGFPIVVYLDSTGDQLWAVRVPRGFAPGQPIAQAAWEFGSLIRDGTDTFLFGGSANRDQEACSVYVNESDDSLHLRYNQRELILRRPDIVDGTRHWEAVNYGTSQYASQWQKIVSFRHSVTKHETLGLRLTGAVDEFETQSLRDPASGTHKPAKILGAGSTPVSFVAATETVTFTNPTGWSAGTPGTFAATANGVTAGVTYYYRPATYLTAFFYDTQAHAQAGGATGKVNLTGTVWTAGAFTPLGRDDGAAIDTSIYWQGMYTLGLRRRPRRIHVQKSVATDAFTGTAYDEFNNTKNASILTGRFHGAFSPGVAGFELSYRIVFAESCSSVDGYFTEEATLGQRRFS